VHVLHTLFLFAKKAVRHCRTALSKSIYADRPTVIDGLEVKNVSLQSDYVEDVNGVVSIKVRKTLLI
jgi:hypothetical protein